MVDRFLEQRLAVAAALNDPRLAVQKDARLVKADLDDCHTDSIPMFREETGAHASRTNMP